MVLFKIISDENGSTIKLITKKLNKYFFKSLLLLLVSLSTIRINFFLIIKLGSKEMKNKSN